MGKKKRKAATQADQAMATQRSNADVSPAGGMWLWAVRLCLLVAASLTLYLSVKGSAALPGCGPESNCDQVLSSHWGRWMGIPITVPGLVLYVIFFFQTFGLNHGDPAKARRALNVLVILSMAILTGALWFVGVQAVAIGAFCPYCCTAHALASLAVVVFLTQSRRVAAAMGVQIAYRGALAVVPLFLALVAGAQWMFPSHAKVQVVKLAPPSPEAEPRPAPPSSGASGAQTPSTTPSETVIATPPVASEQAMVENQPVEPFAFPAEPFPVPNTGIQLDPERVPTLGDPAAPNRFACLFDYTCHHCRMLHGFIRTLLRQYEGTLSCTMIPMPLDSQCNPLMKKTPKAHENACEYARICLAVQALAPEKYDAFDTWLFSDHAKTKPLSAVLAHAGQLVGEDALAQSMKGAAVREQLNINVEVYKINSRNGGRSSMPQTIVKNSVVFGPPPSVKVLENLLKDNLAF